MSMDHHLCSVLSNHCVEVSRKHIEREKHAAFVLLVALKEPVKHLRNSDHTAMPSLALLWEDGTSQNKTNNEQILWLCT